jgi:hypothetical protein
MQLELIEAVGAPEIMPYEVTVDYSDEIRQRSMPQAGTALPKPRQSP